jgi:integrase
MWEEAANLRFEDVTLVRPGDRFRTVLAVEGKGAKKRTVPISDNLARLLQSPGDSILRSPELRPELVEGRSEGVSKGAARAANLD